MDKHFLTSLFTPRSLVIFAGNPGQPDSATPLGRVLLQSLEESGFSGPVTRLDIEGEITAKLSELAQTRADLAIIALPDGQIEAALEIVTVLMLASRYSALASRKRRRASSWRPCACTTRMPDRFSCSTVSTVATRSRVSR